MQSTPARLARRDAGGDEKEHGDMPLEVGGALRSRLEDIRLRPTGYAATRRAEVRDQRSEVRGQIQSDAGTRRYGDTETQRYSAGREQRAA